MATELTVPTLGMDMTEATIVKWLVSEGDEVEKGDPVLEIDTDKTSFEVEAPDTGVISSLSGDEGETLEVGTLIAYILEPGENAPEKPSDTSKPEESEGSEDTEETEDEGSPEPEAPKSEASQEPASDGKGLRASPAARKLAVEREVKISDIPGSGPNGRVYLTDVQNFEAEPKAEPRAPRATYSISESKSEPTEQPAGQPEEGTYRESLTQVRKIGAQRTQQSFAEVPHFYLRRDMDAEGLVALRTRLKEKRDNDNVPSLNDLVAYAVSRVIRDHPRLNARFDDGELVVSETVNLGIAAATEKGLLVPVVKKADTLRLSEFSVATKELLGKARDGRLGRDELSGGTFTISNLGMMGVDSFDAIINQPEAAILAIGSLRTVPQWDGKAFVPRKVISMTLSVDHRVADGADGARFLSDLQDGLSDWELLM